MRTYLREDSVGSPVTSEEVERIEIILEGSEGQERVEQVEICSIPLFIGHRGVGAGKSREENTIQSINACGIVGHMAEIDVQLSKDGEVFVTHDLEIDGVPVDEISSERLHKMNIPLLSEVLKKTKISLNIEIKYEIQSISMDTWCQKIVDVVSKSEPGRYIVYSSFNKGICERMQGHSKDTLFLTEFLTEESISTTLSGQYMGIVTNADEVLNKPELARKIKENNLFLATYGVSNSLLENIEKQREIGVDSIITDEIQQLSQKHIF